VTNGYLSPAMREMRAKYVTARLADGASLAAISRELGIGRETLRLWWRAHSPQSAPTVGKGVHIGTQGAEARAEIIRRRLSEGASMWDISKELGMHYEYLCSWWRSHNVVRVPREVVTKPRQERPCSCCRRTFLSERASGAWLRLCHDCRQMGTGYVSHGICHDGRKGRAR
jgi:transposase-like protein